MPQWKLNIFVNAIKVRMEREGRTAADIIQEYAKLTASEKEEILARL